MEIKSIKEENGVKFKRCSNCNEWKMFDQFSKSTKGIEGLGGYCKICNRLKSKEYLQTSKGKESSRKKALKFYYKNKEKIYNRTFKNGSVGARQKVKYALEIGHIPDTDIEFKKDHCKFDNNECSPGNVHFHHTHGYELPYKGVWLCPRHHKLVEIGKLTLPEQINQ